MTQHEKGDNEAAALETLLAMVREVASRRLNHQPSDVASVTETTPTRDRPKFRLLHGGKAIVVSVGLVEVARQIRDRWITIGTAAIAAGAATATIVYGVVETPLGRPDAPGVAGPTAAPFVSGPTPTPEAHTIAPPSTSPPAPTAIPTVPATATPNPALTTVVVTEPTMTTPPADVPVTETPTTTPPLSPPPTKRPHPTPHPKPTVTPTGETTDISESQDDGTSPPRRHHPRECDGLHLPLLPVCVTLPGVTDAAS